MDRDPITCTRYFGVIAQFLPNLLSIPLHVLSDWRSVVLSPMFNSGSKECASDYRTVSLASSDCMVLEQLLKAALRRLLTSSVSTRRFIVRPAVLACKLQGYRVHHVFPAGSSVFRDQPQHPPVHHKAQ